jgi:hypothetical protein
MGFECRTLSDYNPDAVNAVLRELEAANRDVLSTSVRFTNGPIDAVTISFAPDATIEFLLPVSYPSAELCNLYINRWMSTYRLFAAVKQRYPTLTGACRLWLGDFPAGPGLAFSGNATSHILIPDSTYLGTGGYASDRISVQQQWLPWGQRIDKVFWRGSSTGDRSLLRVTRWQEMPRMKLCLTVRSIGRDDLYDVGLSQIVQIWDKDERDAIAKSDLIRPMVPSSSFMSYRYSIDIDGNTCSWTGLLIKLMMGITVIKIDSEMGFRQWYYDRLIPWINFVPVSASMSELAEVVDWLRAQPDVAQRISERAQELADDLIEERVLEEVIPVIYRYVESGAQNQMAEQLASKMILPAMNSDHGLPLESEEQNPVVEQLTTMMTLAEPHPDHGMPQLVRRALDRAIAQEGKLSEEVLALPGMSGRKYRRFINNLVETLPVPRYLEVGSWAGSTFCSAIFGNDVDAVAIDNWSQFGGPADQFYHHLAKFKGMARVSFLEQDFRQVDYASLGRVFGPFNVYCYDGSHTLEDQYDGIMEVQPALSCSYVQVVDDWNWSQVREGTLKAISDLRLRVDFMVEIRTSEEGPRYQDSDWHNGYCICVLTRL